jgi:hypothetical protein
MPESDEVSFLLRIHESFQNRNFQLLAFTFSDPDIWARAFDPAPFPVLDERRGVFLKRFVSTTNLPLSVVVDKNLIIRFIKPGSGLEIETALREALQYAFLP